MTQARYDVAALKSGGLMKQKEKDLFSVRLRVAGGKIPAEILEKLAAISRKFGKGHIHLTTRQGVEIPYVTFDNFEPLKAALKDAGLELGTCGPRVRTVTACQGGICSSGLIDSQAICEWIDKKYYGLSGLPHKFKIAVSGCPNTCIKPLENDIGIQGVVEVSHNTELCNLCGLCVEACPTRAIAIHNDEKLEFNESLCVGCNDCVAICPTDAWVRGKTGFAVSAGGKMGKFPKLGNLVWKFIHGEDVLDSVIGESIEFYKKHGKRGERFRDTLDRVGYNVFAGEIEERANMAGSKRAATA